MSSVSISVAPPHSADDASFVEGIVSIVNQAYLDAEGGLFKEGYQRTNASEIAVFIRKGQMVVAEEEGSQGGHMALIGSVMIQNLPQLHGSFGMLALSRAHQGKGNGRALIVFAEEECRRRGMATMGVDILFPLWFEHAGKQRLEGWYQRLGYSLKKRANFQESYPHIAALLQGECEYRLYEKSLVD